MSEIGQASVGLIGAVLALIATVVLKAQVRSSIQQTKLQT